MTCQKSKTKPSLAISNPGHAWDLEDVLARSKPRSSPDAWNLNLHLNLNPGQVSGRTAKADGQWHGRVETTSGLSKAKLGKRDRRGATGRQHRRHDGEDEGRRARSKEDEKKMEITSKVVIMPSLSHRRREALGARLEAQLKRSWHQQDYVLKFPRWTIVNCAFSLVLSEIDIGAGSLGSWAVS